MKTAIYVEDGTTQFVFTPESDFEKNVLKQIKESKNRTVLMHGSFYECQGGWFRHEYTTTNDSSFIIRISKDVPETQEPHETE